MIIWASFEGLAAIIGIKAWGVNFHNILVEISEKKLGDLEEASKKGFKVVNPCSIIKFGEC